MAFLKSPISTRTMDFMRGFAAVYVVINHVRGAFFMGGAAVAADAANNPLSIFDYAAIAALRLTSLGTEFVIMFFCVSGMAMAHAAANSPSVLDFYHRRAVRIWPTYIVAIAVAVLAAVLMIWINPSNHTAIGAASLLDGSKLLGMLFYVDVGSRLTPQFWSLPYEVIFYLLAPLLLVSRTSTLGWLTFAAILTIYAGAVVGLQINPADTVIENFFLNALLWFMSGGAAYYYFDRIPQLRPVLFWLATALLLIFVLVVKTALGGSNAISNLAMIVLTLLAVRNLPASLVHYEPTNWGAFSYSIYVYHYAFIALISFGLLEFASINPMEIRSYFAWVAFVPLVLAGCYALYFVAEQPSNQALRRARHTVSQKI